jgi:phage baseplate assembly protein W
MNGKPDLLADIEAINNAIRNLFRCPIGARGPIFRPDYGTFLHSMLQEPLDNITAAKIRASLLASLQKWEPRVRIITKDTVVLPMTAISGYLVRVAYFYVLTNERFTPTFVVTNG